MSSRGGRRRKFLLWSAVGVVALVAVLTARLFVWPPVSHLEKVDAVLVMAGDGRRDQEGLALAREGYAPLLLVSHGLSSEGLSWSDRRLCGTIYYGARIVCFAPHPDTTQGEARFLAEAAARDHLRSVIVVAGRAQTVRAKLRVTRCFKGRVLVDPVAPSSLSSGVYHVIYEWGALLKALVWQRSC